MLDWEGLEKACAACTKCALCETRTHVVFGVGNREAKIMFIGEGPGQQEDLTGEPFVGRAGQLLDDMLAAVDLRREEVYIANIVKCRPPGNRDPLGVEQEACIDYLRNQVFLVKPRVLVCLGRVAASAIIKEDFKITKERGVWHDKGKYRMIATYHPSFLLRDPRRRPEAFIDFKQIKAAADADA